MKPFLSIQRYPTEPERIKEHATEEMLKQEISNVLAVDHDADIVGYRYLYRGKIKITTEFNGEVNS